MIYEFALDPELVATWHERKEYLFFDEKFGLNTGRIISGYPSSKWKKLVWQAFDSSSHGNNENARMRLGALIDALWENTAKRKSTFSKIPIWLERAEAEHNERPFRAIIAAENPREHPHVLKSDDLVSKGYELDEATSTETDDIRRLSKTQHNFRWKQYVTSPAFDLVGDVSVVGTKNKKNLP